MNVNSKTCNFHLFCFFNFLASNCPNAPNSYATKDQIGNSSLNVFDYLFDQMVILFHDMCDSVDNIWCDINHL